MVPEIWSVTDRIFVILDHFLLFYPPPLPPLTTQKIKTLKNWKKKQNPGDIIILHMCTIHDYHLMYDSWDIERNRHIFFVILDHFLPFHCHNNPKNQNFE